MKGAVVSGIALLSLTLGAPTAARSEVPSLLSALNLGGYAPGERAPGFVGYTMHGPRLSLGDVRGKVVILTFWATWCPPCRTDLTLLEDLHRRLGAQQLAVIAVNVQEPSAVVRKYIEALSLTFTVLVDPRGEIQRSYGVIGLPTTFLIARDGRAVARAIGPRDWAGLPSRELVQALLNESVPPETPPETARP
jgi:peroxiredoxin